MIGVLERGHTLSLSKTQKWEKFFFFFWIYVLLVKIGFYTLFIFNALTWYDPRYARVPSRSRPLDFASDDQWWFKLVITCVSLFRYCMVFCLNNQIFRSDGSCSFYFGSLIALVFLKPFDFICMTMMIVAVIRSEPSDLSDGSDLSSLMPLFF